MKRLIIIMVLLVLVANVFAQQKKSKKKAAKAKTETAVVKKDTLPQRTVTVTSAFQPNLKTTAKVNFSAATPSPDTASPKLVYNVPAQNITFSYLSPALKPLAENIDTGIHWQNRSFIKAGYGNYTTPYLQIGASMGDGIRSVVNIKGRYTSSKSSVPFQQFSKMNIDGTGIFNSSNNKSEWTANVLYDNNTQYQYGFLPDTLVFTKDDLRQRFTTFGGSIALRNKQQNPAGINYNPAITLNNFSDNHGSTESNLIISAPMSKTFGKIFAFNLGLTADITTYKSDSAGTVNNNLYSLTPALQFKTPNVKVIAGVSPTWDNEVLSFLPNITAEAKIKNDKFILVAGWVGRFNKTNYQYLASLNPWLQQPKFLLNTRIKEQYAGFKGSAGKHVTYNAKVSYLQFSNQPLFVNDTITGKSFQVVNEAQMNALRVHGEIGYTLQEKLSLLAGVTFNQYSSLQDNEKAWGLLPIELNGSLKWQVVKDFLVKSDIYFWDGAQYRNKSLGSQKLKPAADLNVGVEFTILPNLNGWVQMNNLLNNKYQRWNQYEALGFNVLAGVVFSFGDIKTKIAQLK
ncbi:TonB-dependent receptor [Limnovirga soli]|uniref:TonB-dependent receptor n=1 Tax=Limnovirga soli TaxID=2656915 RepID=A0A8J8FDM4_9BACT|nr:hypothetical protein [Limnovirga soli]NNV54479.1 hypothetical protein [Limnovirga soli]